MFFLDPPSKKARITYPSYFVSELAHVVSMCDEKLPFLAIASELSDRGICHSGVQSEIDATTMVLRILSLPQPPVLDSPPDACVTIIIFFKFIHKTFLVCFVFSLRP